MSKAATAIITKGLSCGSSSACEGGTVITSFFGLYCGYIKDSDFPGGAISPPPPGPRIEDDVPVVDLFRNQPKIKFFVKFNGKKYDVEYNMNTLRSNMVVRIIDVVATSKQRIKVFTSNLHIKNKIAVKISDWIFRNLDK